MSESNRFAIVGEYRNVAILERAGTKRAVWQGREYFTDGRTYVAWVDGQERGGFSFDNEAQVKEFIDVAVDKQHFSKESGKKLLSYREIYLELYGKPLVGKVPQYVFDENAGVFIRLDGVRDGQHRHGSNNE